MTSKIPPNHPLRRFFAGTIEAAFYSELGFCAPDVVAYLTDLLTHFIHVGDIYAFKSAGGDVLQDVFEMVDKAYVGQQVSQERRERLVHRHVGDYTLYWTGLYPESLRRGKSATGYYTEFCEQGKESYAIASRLSTGSDTPPADVLRRLSDHFEDCAYGLTIVRQSWDDTEQTGPEII